MMIPIYDETHHDDDDTSLRSKTNNLHDCVSNQQIIRVSKKKRNAMLIFQKNRASLK